VLKSRPCFINVLYVHIHIRLFVVRIQVVPDSVFLGDGDDVLDVGECDELDRTEHGALWYAAVDVDRL